MLYRIGTIATGCFLLALIIAGVGPSSASAQARRVAPWCAVINQGRDVYWDCQYSSFEQCYPNILGGNRGFCNPNPAYEGAPPSVRHYRRRHHPPR